MQLPKKFKKPYNAENVEGDIYKKWEESGFFNPEKCVEEGHVDKDAETFSIVLPPPNETGVLHIGHASMVTIEDIMVRFKRMQGYQTTWIPGTDHAAIATNAKVEDKLAEDGKTKHDLGREKFLKEVDKFTKKSRGRILEQIKEMGASVDWSRKAYTLDKERRKAVVEAFKKLYEMDLIFKGSRIVNWDPKLQTTVSDDEIERKEEKTKFYYLKYGPFTIATARPETKFGDKYVVMHPDDERYSKYKHGEKIELEWINGKITATIIKDEAIDPEFGTGVMTITPWHDATDFKIAERHDLDKEQVIDFEGKLLPVAGEFEGIKIEAARPKIVEKLDQKGLLEKVDEDYIHNVARNSRGGGLIEPQIMKQWFIDVDKEFKLPHSKIKGIDSGETVTLKKLMAHVVKTSQIEIIPDNFEKVYFHWIEKLRNWNISRQIWFGHRVPIWYKNGEIKVSEESPGAGWEQDEDTLDTWFSSGLWTFSTLGWPEETKDLDKYHPTSVLETGYDIIFFWVARMILMTTALLGEVPFKTVYLHGLVRDEKGQKISKSLGNNIDPKELIDEYGADAVRMSLIVGVGPGSDNSLSEEKIKAYKHFANKIWNASKFVMMNLGDDFDYSKKPEISPKNKKYLEDFDKAINEITENLEKFYFHLAAEDIYHYFWHSFADEILEENKEALYGDSEEAQKEAQWVLYHILTNSLKLLHPFMPFITEEIWSHLPKKEEGLLMVENWPKK